MTAFILICWIFPPHPGKNQILHPHEELTRLISQSPGTENSQMPWVSGGGVGVSIWLVHYFENQSDCLKRRNVKITEWVYG